MTESTRSAQPSEITPSGESAARGASAPPDGRPSSNGSPLPDVTTTQPSVRELLAELAQLEDATRGLGGLRRPTWSAQSPDMAAALAREQEIIDELHRRCPDARATMSSRDDIGVARHA